jgi:hypothetical protein
MRSPQNHTSAPPAIAPTTIPIMMSLPGGTFRCYLKALNNIHRTMSVPGTPTIHASKYFIGLSCKRVIRMAQERCHRDAPPTRAERTQLIVAPPRCPLHSRAWGWAVQLYAAWATASWGYGHLADLRWLADSCSLSRCMRRRRSSRTNRAHMSGRAAASGVRSTSIEAIPGAEMLRGLDDLLARGHALNSKPRLDRDTVLRLKLKTLERLWTAAVPPARFDVFRAAHGAPLEAFASFRVLADRHGPRLAAGGQPR